ncbi:twinkle protein [Rhodoblastus acidophilus]|uniref:DnaB-like helicase C-terminal domain-containing protein n=1 Tax=Rhodoblastus acidophilus TaxID=1074 RepID=UPI002224E3CD|nr:DnaB-like helicase C-terminal domain-containing protein [Rhodoblastus acidophilus]MCW2317114.1 twinkle protein [Rhodoblastus acidophilus]
MQTSPSRKLKRKSHEAEPTRYDNPPDFPEGNGEVVSKGPCPNCPTEFGNVTYADGHTHCFACNTTSFDGSVSGEAGRVVPHAAPAGTPGGGTPGCGLLSPADQTHPFQALDKRKLTQATLKRFGYFLAGFKGQTVHAAPYFSQDNGTFPVVQKLRFPNKEFVTLKSDDGSFKGGINNCRLFGHHVFGDKYDRKVVVTEGELDAMSVAQATDFKFAVVSVGSGAAGAAKHLKKNYLWLDRFEEIILWFDDDEPGQQAAAECAQLFAVGKVRIAKAPGYKDASEVLQDNKPGDIESAIYMATAWRPAGIVNAADSVADVLAPKPEDPTQWSYHWPWHEVEEMLGPMRPGQVCYHVAGTGIGKTTGIAEIEYHLLKQDPHLKIAHMGFEDTRRDVKLRLLSIHTSQRLDQNPLPDEQMAILHQEVFGGRQVELFDPETAEWTVDAILGYVRYCAKALDCKIIFIDPLTFIAAGLSLGDDERRALDKASRDLAAMAKELSVHLQVTHHLKRPDGTAHEEGAATSLNEVRGSGGIANFATFVIGHERNQQAEGELALVTQLRSLKNRPRGRTGTMKCLLYSPLTGRLQETDLQFPEPGKPKKSGGKGGGQQHNFPVSSDY